MMDTGAWDERTSGFLGVHAHGSSGHLAIAIGVVLVRAGLEFWRRVSRTDPAVLEGPGEFRAILDALDQEDGCNDPH
jgi:hypothetical protein